MDPITLTATGSLAAVGIGIGAFFRFGPGKLLGAMADAMLGEPEVRDRRNEVIVPGSPGLVHRVAQVEEAVVEFRHMTGLLTEVLGRVDNIENRVGVLEGAAYEKAATKLESAAMFDMVAKRDSDVINEPEETQ